MLERLNQSVPGVSFFLKSVGHESGYANVWPCRSLLRENFEATTTCNNVIQRTDTVREALLNGRLTCTPVEFLTFYDDIFWPNPEVIALIPQLKPRYRLVLASNTNDAHYRRYSYDYAQVLSYFDHLVPSHQAGSRKPHPEFFAYAKQFALAEPAECVFVDDMPINVEAADRAGLGGLLYTPNQTLLQKLRAAGVEIGTT